MRKLGTRLAALERMRKPSLAEMSDAELMSIALETRFRRAPSREEVQDGLGRLKALTNEKLAAIRKGGPGLMEVLYAA